MTQDIKNKKRRPLVALLFGLVFPGLGHLYAGKYRLAIVWLIASVVVPKIMLLAMVEWDARPFNIIIPMTAGLLSGLFYLGHAWWTARRQPEDYVIQTYNRWYFYSAWAVLATLVFWYTQPHHRNYKFPSESMENAIFAGDHFLADLSAYDSDDPVHGDIVAFIFPLDGETRYVKRCVAVGGDTVEIIDKTLYVNGIPAEEPPTVKYIDTTSSGQLVVQPRRSGGADSRDNFGPFVVPGDTYFMLGDNRDNSYDSRYWGIVPRELILGKAVRVHYSSDWSRIGLKVE